MAEDINKPAGDAPKTVVALRYDMDRDRAPLILATGRGAVADEILRIADDNQIPLYEDPELAKLLAKLEMDTEIPPELYTLVAEVLFFVYKLDRMAKKREAVVRRLKEEEKDKRRP
ncbi:MAG: EscU/YscU/HrcU family type III secretion system export apparatus switch protein [Candidatus Margulisbacteria bacterium]|nr:EscU/YscU/HrcU family type III secretion system export apparatus switch protein [Candidatus Margulisiibacteriota bacterium]